MWCFLGESEEWFMKFGIRKPNLKSSLKARTTGRAKRAVKRAVIPGYGKKGMGWVTNPKRAAYNKIYHKTTVGAGDILSGSAGAKTAHAINSETVDISPVYYDKTILLCTILGGWFGLHKYMRKQIGMGILYTFTAGLFCIGWIVDIIAEATRPRRSQ